MKTILISAAALHIILFILMVRALRKAPVGYQNSTGFHFGKEPNQTDEEQPNVTHPAAKPSGL